MLACAFATRAEVVAALIEEGADASASSIAGWQPLHFLAANNTSTEAPLMAEALMRAGASAQAPTDQSTLETPIAMANKFNPQLVPTLESTDPRGFDRIKLAKSVKTLFGVDAFKAAEHQLAALPVSLARSAQSDEAAATMTCMTPHVPVT